MRTTLVILILASGVAHADDRAMVVDVGGGFVSSDGTTNYGEARLSLGWEREPLAIPATKGHVFDLALVPELVAGGFIASDRAEMFVGAGLRGELRMAQRDMGLLQVTARGAIYLALRGLVVGAQREPVIELGIGEYFTRLHNRSRIGFELDALIRTGTDPTLDGISDGQSNGMLFQIYVGG